MKWSGPQGVSVTAESVVELSVHSALQRALCAFTLFLALVVTLFHSLAAAESFLEAEQAFPVAVSGSGSQWTVEFQVADGYYLYRDKIAVKRPQTTGSDALFSQGKPLAQSAAGISQASAQSMEPSVDIPAGKRKFDENLGKEVETLRNRVRIQVLWTDTPPDAVDIHSQGCADAGLCYPPMVQRVKLNSASAQFPGGAPMGASAVVSADESGALAQRLKSGNAVWVLAAFFGLGVLLAFTPCVLPMVPILSAVIVGQQHGQQRGTPAVSAASGRWRSVALAAAYVAGMSLVYTAVGVVAGLTGEGLVAAMQQPGVLFTFSAFLMAFGIAMLGAWDMQLPLTVQNWVNERSQRLQGGQFAPVFIMGGLSAVLVGPCVAPPLAGALLYLSATGDWLLGGAALMALSWGLGAPLILAAAAADQVIPRAGAWMESVKRFFGFLLMALAIYTAAPVVSTPLLMAAWCVFLLFSAAWAGALQVLPPDAAGTARVRQGFAWVLLLGGVLQGVGAGLGAEDVFRPLAPLSARNVSVNNAATPPPQGKGGEGAGGVAPATADAVQGGRHGLPFRVVSSAQAMEVIASLKQPAMLDFYAEWCVSCKEMERFTFTDPTVRKALEGVVWLQVDVTHNTAEDKALLKRFRLFGPPGILFFDANGQEIADVRVVGFQNAQQFAQTVKVFTGRL